MGGFVSDDFDEHLSLWAQIKDLRSLIEEQEEEVQHILQGALFYDPEMVEGHRKLIEFEYAHYLHALSHSDGKRHTLRLRGVE